MSGLFSSLRPLVRRTGWPSAATSKAHPAVLANFQYIEELGLRLHDVKVKEKKKKK
jgi:hypothetical protein